jgi:glycerophosphoryl diester phosphodiesterase
MWDWTTIEAPLLYAHRGAQIEAPENTMPAFRRALELGADVLELDVHPSRDDTFVVSHDATGKRMCDVDRPIRKCLWSEIATWDAGWGFVDSRGERPFAGGGVRPARFEEVLTELGETLLNVDIKEARRDEIDRLIAVIRGANAEPRVLLTSFSKSRLDRVRAARYGGPVGLSRRDVMRLFLTPEVTLRLLPLRGDRAQIPTRWLTLDLSQRSDIEKCHRLRIGADYWVVNSVAEAENLLERGADGIITDDTARMAELFRRSPHTVGWRDRHAG